MSTVDASSTFLVSPHFCIKAVPNETSIQTNSNIFSPSSLSSSIGPQNREERMKIFPKFRMNNLILLSFRPSPKLEQNHVFVCPCGPVADIQGQGGNSPSMPCRHFSGPWTWRWNKHHKDSRCFSIKSFGLLYCFWWVFWYVVDWFGLYLMQVCF